MQADINEYELFGQLLELDERQREEELSRLAQHDASLASRLWRLFEAHSSGVLTGQAAAPSLEPELEWIGPYRTIERIGQGGMGNVYLCEQTTPVRRTVAAKVLKAGMDTREVIARFEAERQALALMNHSCIAPILDAGATQEGRPYFVMEYVPGMALIRYCRERELNLRARLGLFMQICLAVQHAHQKGVIHRDLKPSNILIMDIDGQPHPKIIDFGIAKATGAQLTGKTLHTVHGNLVGTPEYMSPEQADIGAIDVDTRADIYSLGILLYELLAGTVPFNFSRQLLSLSSIQRRLRSEPVVLPSRKLLEQPDRDAHAVSVGYRDAGALAAAIRGDLDWIVRKALEKDRTRRYASAAELCADVERYLHNRPVLAARGNSLYLLGKFLRRNALPVAGSAMLVALLLGFSTYANLQAKELARERDRANYQTAKARQITDFLINLFAIVDPQSGYNRDMTIREAVDIGARRIRTELQHQPDVRNALLFSIGRVYNALGLYQEAESVLRSVIDYPGSDQQLLLQARVELAGALSENDAFTSAETLLLDVIEATADGDALNADARLALGGMYIGLARFPEAEQNIRHVLDSSDPLDPEQAGTRAAALRSLGDFLVATSRFDEALEPLQQAYTLAVEQYGEASSEALDAGTALAAYYATTGKHEEALPYFERNLASAIKTYGEAHPATGIAYNDLGFVLVYLRKFDGAERALQQALETMRKVYGDEHSETATAMVNLAGVYDRTDRVDLALPLYKEGLRIRRELHGPDSTQVATTQQNIAYALLQAEDHAGAAAAFDDALRIFALHDMSDHWLYGNALRGRGSALLGLKLYDEAESALCKAHVLLTDTLGADHDRVKRAEEWIERLYQEWQQAAPGKAPSACPDLSAITP